MTRKRTRESLSRTLTQPCHYCDGKGFTKSPTSVAYEILRHLRRELVPGRFAAVNVACHPLVAELLAHGESDHTARLEERLGVTLLVHAERAFHLEQYDIQGHRAGSGAMPAAGDPGSGP
jgi:ribonuclease G